MRLFVRCHGIFRSAKRRGEGREEFRHASVAQGRRGRSENKNPTANALIHTSIQLLTKYRSPERPSEPYIFFAFHTNFETYLLGTAERARMRETALLTATYYLFFSRFKSNGLFFWQVFFFHSPKFKNPVLWEYHIQYYLDTASSRYSRNGPGFLRFLPSRFCCGCVKLSSYQKRSHPHDLRLAHHIIITSSHHHRSSAQRRTAAPAQQHSGSSVAQRRAVQFPGMPWRALARGAALRCCACYAVLCRAVRMLCGVVPYCAVLCRAVPW